MNYVKHVKCKRLSVALYVLCLLLFVGYIPHSLATRDEKSRMVVQDVQLEEIKQRRRKRNHLHHLRQNTPEPPKVEMVAKFTPPKIVKDEDVKEDEKPPEVEKAGRNQDRYSQPGRY